MRNILLVSILSLTLLMMFPNFGHAVDVEKNASKDLATSAFPIVIAPHRAVYTMSLASVKNGSNVAGVNGSMSFEWADVCDAWAIQQHLKLHFNYSGGTESDVTSNELTWESKDGKSYRFNIQRSTDGKDDEEYRGKAKLDSKGGTVSYAIPTSKAMKLPAGALFPSAHTKLIIEKAQSGDHFFSRRVFDGSDEDGSSDISVFIDHPQTNLLEKESSADLKKSPLLKGTAWPVRMAFFKVDTETGEPDYEMDMTILANGVVQSMRIDYGDFTVLGTLTTLAPLPAPHC